MLTTIYGKRTLTLDVAVRSVTWATPETQVGEAVLRIPRNSVAWDSDVIDERGGFLVDIQTGHGLARLIADSPKFTPEHMEITAKHPNVWAQIRYVSSYREFYGVTAGIIVRRAVKDALEGLGSVPVTMGHVLEAPPLIDHYVFRGQKLIDVVNDMMDQTGHQWMIDEHMKFHWKHRIGRYREIWIIDDGKYLPNFQQLPLSDQTQQAIEIDSSGRSFTAAERRTPLLWPAQNVRKI